MRKYLRLADAPSQVAAKTFMSRKWQQPSLLVAKLVKLNLKELTTLRNKKNCQWDVNAFAS